MGQHATSSGIMAHFCVKFAISSLAMAVSASIASNHRHTFVWFCHGNH